MPGRGFGIAPRFWLLALLLSISRCSCDDGASRTSAADGGADSSVDNGGPLSCAKGHVQCDGTVAKVCDGKGGYSRRTDCGAHGQACVNSTFDAAGELLELGCVKCVPAATSCSAGIGKLCRADGSGFDSFECDPMQGMVCDPDGCKGACAPPAVTTSYIGCDYYPTVTLNPVWSGFDFAVAVSNASDAPAHVTLTRGDDSVRELTIDPEQLEVVPLPWVSALKGGDQDACQLPPEPGDSRLVTGGAYRLRSDRPVTVYQFSPLQYQRVADGGGAPAGCPVGTQCPGGIVAECLSYSNDASLLLPATALSGDYTVMSWPSHGNTSSFFAVTATADDTHVTLDGHGRFRPGAGVDQDGRAELTLARGDVVEVLASHGADTDDATGSIVHADKPVQVIGGHSCANVPDPGTSACDHLEQALFPTQILGKEYVVSYPAAVASQSPNVVRIEAIEPDTHIEFDPAVAEPVTLGPDDPPMSLQIGAYDRARPDAQTAPVDVYIRADKAIVVAQYMQGQTSVPSGAGDPSMTLAVPVAQYRDDYIFTASSTYDANFINLIAPIGTTISLDGQALSGARADVGSSGFSVQRVRLPADGTGVYRVHGDAPFGLVVYGYGRYTSYMYPGGLDLKRITAVTPE